MTTQASTTKARLAVLAARWRSDLLTNVVPFWLNHSLDEEHGGYFTALDRFGSVLDESKFVWLQGRAVWTWSRLHNELRSEVPVEDSEKWWAAARCGRPTGNFDDADDDDDDDDADKEEDDALESVLK